MAAGAWLGPLIGGIFGSAMSSRSNSRATQASSRASAEALAFAREQEAQRRKEYEERLAMEKAQWEAREQRKSEILARYGRSYTARPFAPGAPAPTPTPSARPGTAPSMGSAPMAEPGTPRLTAPRTPWGYR